MGFSRQKYWSGLLFPVSLAVIKKKRKKERKKANKCCQGYRRREASGHFFMEVYNGIAAMENDMVFLQKIKIQPLYDPKSHVWVYTSKGIKMRISKRYLHCSIIHSNQDMAIT